jgi:hypothetical protein
VIAGLVALVVSSAPALAQKRTAPRAASPAPAKSVSLPAFSFKQAQAGETMDPSAVGKCSPTDDGVPEKLECRGSDPMVAGIHLLLAPSYYFYNSRLTSMLFLYDNDGANFLTLLGAFRDKYGTPCNTAMEKWQNRAGSTFDNSTATWCFKTGKLKLEQIGPSLKYGVVTYTDQYDAPSKGTPKDF